MSTLKGSRADGYEAFYRDFDSPLMGQLRREAYGEDIGNTPGSAPMRFEATLTISGYRTPVAFSI